MSKLTEKEEKFLSWVEESDKKFVVICILMVLSVFVFGLVGFREILNNPQNEKFKYAEIEISMFSLGLAAIVIMAKFSERKLFKIIKKLKSSDQ